MMRSPIFVAFPRSFTLVCSTLAVAGLSIGSGCGEQPCAAGEISAACPAEPESAPAEPAEPDVTISAPPTTCDELVAEFSREVGNRAEDHDRCLDDTDCIAFTPQYLCGDGTQVTACPIALASSLQADFQADVGAYGRALCGSTADLSCVDVDPCRTGAPICTGGRCELLDAPERTCEDIDSDFAASVTSLAEDGRNSSAADNCVLMTEDLICDGVRVASACPVAISPDFRETYDAAMAALRERLCADAADREVACEEAARCEGTYVAEREGLQCTSVLVNGADAGPPDADAGEADAGPVDAGGTDAGPADAGPADSGVTDAGAADAGPADAGDTDAGPADAGPADAGDTDAGPADAGVADAGPADGGVVDAG